MCDEYISNLHSLVNEQVDQITVINEVFKFDTPVQSKTEVRASMIKTKPRNRSNKGSIDHVHEDRKSLCEEDSPTREERVMEDSKVHDQSQDTSKL